MKYIVFFISVLLFQITYAQSQQNDLTVTIGASAVPNFAMHKVGVDVSVRYYFADAFSFGGHFYTVNPRFNHGFGFDTDRTLVNIYSFSVPLQYYFINTDKLSLNFGLSNGALLNVLRNRNESKEVVQYDPDTGQGTSIQLPKRLKNDAYYTLTPFAEASVKFLEIDQRESIQFFVTGKVGYQNAFGNGYFSNAKDFSDFVFSLGITVKSTYD